MYTHIYTVLRVYLKINQSPAQGLSHTWKIALYRWTTPNNGLGKLNDHRAIKINHQRTIRSLYNKGLLLRNNWTLDLHTSLKRHITKRHFTEFYVFTQSSVVFQQYAPLNLHFVLIALYISKDLSSHAIGLYFCTNCSVLLGRVAIVWSWKGDQLGIAVLLSKWRGKI